MRRIRYLVASTIAAAAILTATVPVPADAALNGRIAFSRFGRHLRNSQIFTILPDGSDMTRLTFTRADNYSPAWSPDGSRIAFVRVGRAGVRAKLMSMDADGTARTIVLRDWRSIERPDWFPDGTKILFCSAGVNYRLFVVSPDGSGLTMVGKRRSCDASVSPDGSKIAFVRFDKNLRHPNVWVMNSDGTGLTPITDDGHSTGPSWSPDGARIAFIRSGGWGESEVFVMDADGTNESQLTAGARSKYGPTAWSPDGNLIAYHQTVYWDAYSSTDVVTIAPDGSNATQVTDSPGIYDEGADWQSV